MRGFVFNLKNAKVSEDNAVTLSRKLQAQKTMAVNGKMCYQIYNDSEGTLTT